MLGLGAIFGGVLVTAAVQPLRETLEACLMLETLTELEVLEVGGDCRGIPDTLNLGESSLVKVPWRTRIGFSVEAGD